MSEQPFRVPPALDETNEFFWTAGADGLLRFLRCQTCGYYLHPPIPRCPECGSLEVAPEAVSGRGEVFTFTVNHQSWDGTPDPYVIAIVSLAEQEDLRLTTNLIGLDPGDVAVGLPVQVEFEEHDGIWWPLFSPASDAEAAR
jgi:uncharacterized OB-fold protein